MTNPTKKQIDRAVRLVSVSRSFRDLQRAMERGYVPTLRTDDAAAPTAELKAATRLVIEMALAAGHPVYAPVNDDGTDAPSCRNVDPIKWRRAVAQRGGVA